VQLAIVLFGAKYVLTVVFTTFSAHATVCGKDTTRMLLIMA
jgi:hypothetical protein